MTNIERIKNLVEEYCKSFRNKLIMRYDNTDETDDAIQLYVKSLGVSVDFCLYAMIELNIDKKLEIYEKVLNMTSNYEKPTVEFNGIYYDLRYADYRDSLITQMHFFRALYYANFLNRSELYRKILEIGGKNHFEKVKTLLDVGGLYIDNVGCRAELLDYINKHSCEEEEIGL